MIAILRFRRRTNKLFILMSLELRILKQIFFLWLQIFCVLYKALLL